MSQKLLLSVILVCICISLSLAKRKKGEATKDDKDTKEINQSNSFGLGSFFSNLDKLGESKGYTQSKVYSYSYSNDGKNKPESHIRSMRTEEYLDKKSPDKPAEIRKYGELLKKDNDNPALLKKRASTNVEKEELLLGDGKEERVLSDEEFKVS